MSNLDPEYVRETLELLRGFDLEAEHTTEERRRALERYRQFNGFFNGRPVDPLLYGTTRAELAAFERKFGHLI